MNIREDIGAHTDNNYFHPNKLTMNCVRHCMLAKSCPDVAGGLIELVLVEGTN